MSATDARRSGSVIPQCSRRPCPLLLGVDADLPDETSGVNLGQPRRGSHSETPVWTAYSRRHLESVVPTDGASPVPVPVFRHEERVGSLSTDRLLRVVSRRTTGLLVFAFPPSGSGPSLFRRWLPDRPSGLELVAIHAPGREDRCTEPAVSTVAPLADDIAEAIDRYGERPYVIFGHSAGALLGREVAWRLRQRARPLSLFVAAGSAAPDVAFGSSLADADDTTLLDALRDWGGTPDDVLGPDAIDVFLPCLRADMALAESCRRNHPPTADDRLDIPIIAITGTDDPAAEFHCQSWSAWTDAASVAHVVPGGHFFPFENPRAVLEILAREASLLGGHTGG